MDEDYQNPTDAVLAHCESGFLGSDHVGTGAVMLLSLGPRIQPAGRAQYPALPVLDAFQGIWVRRRPIVYPHSSIVLFAARHSRSS
jgi:hypothetical protein